MVSPILSRRLELRLGSSALPMSRLIAIDDNTPDVAYVVRRLEPMSTRFANISLTLDPMSCETFPVGRARSCMTRIGPDPIRKRLREFSRR
jgi:hypothetical protein